MSANRGIATSIRWQAHCKDCGRHDDPAEFVYPDAWIEGVVERGGTRSDRCPSCRQKHARDARSMAVPYIDLKTIGQVADRKNPTGPLGGLGPLPVEHERNVVKSDLGRFDFGLTDSDASRLLTGLEEKQVAIVVAGTGSGKSTFLPYRLLVPPDDAALHLADRGPIIVTEPRVFAAIDVATFIATELHGAPAVGPGCDIGYRVKGKPAFDSSCRLLFVTDGSLINWLRDGSLDKFGAIVIDEAHERSKNIDVILALLRAELPKHPNLRVLVLSATIDAEFFRDYFGGAKKVMVLDDIEVKKQWGYGNALWPDDPVELDHPDWAADKKFRGQPLRGIAERLAALRVLKGREIPVASWRDQMPQLVADQAVAIARGTDWGDILGFLPGEDAISAAVGEIKKQLVEANMTKWDVYGLLRSTPEPEQRAARCEREEGDNRRIVVSTNIAETSLTIDGLTYVVDSGLINQSKWDVATASKSIPATRHSKDGVHQRWGRVGRKAPGWVFPLYTRDQFADFLDHTPPEAVRDDLESLVLTAKAAGIDDPTEFLWPAAFERPGADKDDEAGARVRAGFERELKRSVTALRRRDAIDEHGDITPWGGELLGFSGTPAEAGAVAGADELACAVEATTAITLLGRSALMGPKGILLFDEKWTPTARNVARRLHQAMKLGCTDELDLALKIYGAWERAADPEAWAKASCVNHDLLEKASETRAERLEFLSPGRKSPISQPLRMELAPRVRAVLSRALVDFTFVDRGDRWVSAESEDGISYQLSERSHLEGCDRVVALRRGAGRGGGFLSGLVASYDWAADIGSWTELALEASQRLRQPDGGLPGSTTEEALAFQDEWPVGARVRCSFGADGQVTAAELISPPPPDPLAVQELEEPELDPDAEPSDAEPIELAEPAPTVGQRGGDLVGVLQPPGEELLNPEMEPQYEDPADREPDDEDTDGEADESSEAAEQAGHDQVAALFLELGPLASRPQLRLDWDEDPGGGDQFLRVLGYEGVGADRVVLAVVQSDTSELDSGLAEAIKTGAERHSRALERVSDWGPPFLVAQDIESGLDVCVPAHALTLSADGQDSALGIEPGIALGVTPVQLHEAHSAIAGSRLPELQRHLKEAESVALDEGSAPFYPATVAERRDDARFINVRLEHADESRGLLHQFSVPARALHRSNVPLAEGAPLLAQLKPEASKEPSGWIERGFSNLPEGLPRICDGLQLTYQLGTPTMLRAAPGMPHATRNALRALSPGRAWQLAVNHLWRASHASDGDIDGWVIKPIQKAPPGVAELCDDEVLQLEQGQKRALKAAPGMSDELRDQLLHLTDQVYWQSLVNDLWRDVTGESEATPNSDGWFEKEVSNTPNGLAEMCDGRTLAYQEYQPTMLLAAPNMREELRDQLLTLSDNTQWQGAVHNLWKESNGESLPSIGSDGWAQRLVAAAADGLEDLLGDELVFIQGQPTLVRAAPLMSLELRDSLLSLSEDPSWLGTIGKVWRQTNGLGVSKVRRSDATEDFAERLHAERRDALLEMLPEDGRVTGTVTEVEEFGVIVQLNEIDRTALLHKSAMGDFGVGDPSRFFADGDEIVAEIKEVGARDGRDRILLAIGGTDLELDAVRRRFPEGERFEGTVSNVVDFGVFVDLGGASGLLHTSSIGSGGGVLDLSQLFSIGQEVSGQVDGIARGKSNRLEIKLSMPDLELPSLLEQVREAFPEGEPFEGTVSSLVDFGVFVDLGAMSGLVHKNSIGSGSGVLDLSQLFSVGQKVRGRIDGIAHGKNDRLEIRLSMPDLELPSLLDQVRDVYPDGATERGRLNKVADFGAFISLRYGLSGLVSNRSMSPTDRAKIGGLSVGDAIDVVVLGVRMGKRRVEINLRLA